MGIWKRAAVSVRSVATGGALFVASVGPASCELPELSRSAVSDDHAISMDVLPSGRGWMVTFSGFSQEPSHIGVRIGDGEVIEVDQPRIVLPQEQAKTEIALTYTIDGEAHGPIVFPFSPREEQIDFVKASLRQSKAAGWASWRRYSGKDSVYFSSVLSYGCAVGKVEYSFDDVEWVPLPVPCKAGASGQPRDMDTLTFSANAKRGLVLRVTVADGTVMTSKSPNPNFGSSQFDERDVQGADNKLAVYMAFEDFVARCSAGREDGDCQRFGGALGEVREEGRSPLRVVARRYCEARGVGWLEAQVGEGVDSLSVNAAYARQGEAWVPRRVFRAPGAYWEDDLCALPVDEPQHDEPASESDTLAEATTWAEAVMATRPCWALNSGEVHARVAERSGESLASVEERLSTDACKKGRERAANVLGAEHLDQIDSAIAVYEKVVALHQEFLARAHPRAEDRGAFEVAVAALRADFPSLAEQRRSMKEVYRALVKEVRSFECRGSMERLTNEVQELERAFSSGMPVTNVKAREDARAGAVRVLRDLDARCSEGAEGMSRAATRLVEDASLVLDHHEELVRFGTGEGKGWRSKTVRIPDEATRLESSTLAVYREMALFVATAGVQSQ